MNTNMLFCSTHEVQIRTETPRTTRAFGHIFCLMFCISLLASTPAFAHRVNIFTWVDGKEVVLEAGFSKKYPVKNGGVIVFDGVQNTEILRGTTNEQGVFRFAMPQIAAVNGLNVQVTAGEGHQSSMQMSAEECATAFPDAEEQKPSAVGHRNDAVQPRNSAATQKNDTEHILLAQNSLSVQELQTLIEESVAHELSRTLERELAPIKRSLAAQQSAEPSLQDIIGGLGWLIGLAGFAAYFRSKMCLKNHLPTDKA